MQEYVKDFLEDIKTRLGYSNHTCLAYEADLRRFMGYLQLRSGDSPGLDLFNTSQIAGFIEAERQAGWNRSTLLRRRSTLQSFAAYLQRRKVLPEAPFEYRAAPVLKSIASARPQNQAEILIELQIRTLKELFEASRRPRAPRDYALFSLLLETGIPVGKLVNLDMADVRVEKSRIDLNLDYPPTGWFRLDSANKAMLSYVNEGRFEFSRQTRQPALFLNQTGQRMSRQGVWQVLQFWGRAARLPFTLAPQLVRNTAALHLKRAGVPLESVQRLLGHSNPHSTQALFHRLENQVSE